MKKILIRTGIGLLSLIALIGLGLAVMTFFFSDKIESLAISEINKQLATEVKVNGDIDFSFFSKFPYAALELNKVTIRETLPAANNLVESDKISLLINLWNFLRKNYTIDKVVAEDGMAVIRIDSAGRRNYDIFRQASTGDGTDFSLQISDAVLKNFRIEYIDEGAHHHYSFHTDEAALSGQFSASTFTLSINARALSDYLRIEKTDYLSSRSIQVDGTIYCDLTKEEYIFNNTSLRINGNQFFVGGKVISLKQGNDLQLEIESENLPLQQLTSLLPLDYAERISDISGSGKAKFHCTISGILSASSNPEIKGTFQLENGSISHTSVKQALQQVNLKGIFTNGDHHNLSSSEVSIHSFSAVVEKQPVHGSILLRNFEQPFMDASLSGKVQLAKIYPFLKNEAITSLNGTVNFQECYYRGPVSALASFSDFSKLNAGGKFELINVAIATTDASYENLNGSFEIKNNEILFPAFSFTAGKSDLMCQGTVQNLIPYFVSALNSSVASRQKVGVNINLASSNMVWEDLVGKDTSDNSSGDDYAIPEVFYRLSGSISGRIDQFRYRRFHASEISGKVLFLPNSIYFNNMSMQAEGGSITASGKLDISDPKHSRLELTSSIKQLDIARLFYEFYDFDQSTLTHRHLKGSVTAEISLQSVWDDHRLNEEKLRAIAEVTVENGELNNFEPMRALSEFVKLNELEHMRFSKMQNQLEIRNSHVFIPEMKIYSNALNVTLSGSHSFENIIDYKVQLNLLRMLTGKFRKNDSYADAGEETTEGLLNLYLTMTGPADDPVIKYDKKAVKQKIATDLAQEKSNVKEILKKEFNQQEAQQSSAGDFQPESGIRYFEFENDSTAELAGKTGMDTKDENQKNPLEDFKALFKKQPKK